VSVKIKVKVKPNAGRNEVKRLADDAFEVKVSVAPEKGKANERVRELLADFLDVAKSRVTLVRGETSREKLFEVT
jgi:uncharacterized protein (TIGR00251 family)